MSEPADRNAPEREVGERTTGDREPGERAADDLKDGERADTDREGNDRGTTERSVGQGGRGGRAWNGPERRYDLQVHTDASPCSGASPGEVVDAAVDAGLDGIAVTNHDTMVGIDEVRRAAPDDLTVIPGVEVTTTAGHVLALDVDSVPAPGDPLSVVEAIDDLGGVAILSHPFDRLREHFDGDLAALADAVDAVESVNSRCLRRSYVERARSFAAEHGLPTTGGSDAHFPMEVGRAYTVCGDDPVDAIRRGETLAGGTARYLSGHAATKLHEVTDRLRPWA